MEMIVLGSAKRAKEKGMGMGMGEEKEESESSSMGDLFAQHATKSESEIRHVFCGTAFTCGALQARDVDAHELGGLEGVGGFFECLAGATILGRLARVEVARRVVQAQALRRVFFDQQVTTLAFNDGGDGDTGLPTLVHLHIIFRVSPPENRS